MAESTLDTPNSPHVTRFDGELNIESIISAPLIAASKANAIILNGQTDFILNNCFRKKEINGKEIYQPIMVEMSLNQPIANRDSQSAESNELYFQMPMLCLLPLNAIAIDKVNVNFDLEITSVNSYKSGTNLFRERAVLNGKIASSCENKNKKGDVQSNNQSTARLNVNINVNKLPLSKGILTLLDLYSKSIQPIQKPTTEKP